MSNKIISIDTLKYYNDKVSNYVDEKVSDTIDNLGLDELNAILVDTDEVADDPSVPDYVTENELETALSSKMDKVTLATVATSGNYNDLTNKPIIPSAVTENTVSGWGFTKNTGTYSKPSGGIPKSDLTSAVQTSLGKADTALQSYTEQYKGTVTGVKINGTTKNPSSGVVDLGTVITSHQTLKTINGESIVGSGNIEISGGSSLTESDIAAMGFTKNAGTITEVKMNGVSKGTSGVVDLGDTGVYSIVESSETSITLLSNRMTKITTPIVDSLEINLPDENEEYTSECIVTFNIESSSTSAELIVPADVKWANNVIPSMTAGKTYEISFLNKYATFLEY